VSHISSAAFSISSAALMSTPESTSASGILGVITVASGNNLLFNMLIASSLISLAPLVATITGSTTIFPALYSVSLSAITSISSPEATIPVLTASGYISVNILSSCSAKNLGDTSIISVTPVVFCAVRAVIALIAYTRLAVIVFISACIPAPPLESLPAIVKALYIHTSLFYEVKCDCPCRSRGIYLLVLRSKIKSKNAGTQLKIPAHKNASATSLSPYVGIIHIRLLG